MKIAITRVLTHVQNAKDLFFPNKRMKYIYLSNVIYNTFIPTNNFL